jgi:hypothetical protein
MACSQGDNLNTQGQGIGHVKHMAAAKRMSKES